VASRVDQGVRRAKKDHFQFSEEIGERVPSTRVLTKAQCSTYLLYMQTITSRDLVHRSKEIRKLLSAGQTLRWTSHGSPVALIQPASAEVPLAKPDWISRARAAGAVNSSTLSVADTVYQDRD
jgi:antitoxin (DNA-binding transcriptional repressor) of toxin-antitoxin stability system